MKILLTNDDGIYAKGLTALYNKFSLHYEVVVIAPDSEQSAVGHGLTLHTPIRAKRIKMKNGETGYAVSGTPVDCIKLGFLDLLDDKPDLVVSGINRGANTGVNINYSGTAAAAREAALYNIPSIAASVKGQKTDTYEDAAEFIYDISIEVIEKGLPKGSFLNVNIPDIPLKNVNGVKICRQSQTFPDEFIDKRKDPRGTSYYWHGCEFSPLDTDSEFDSIAIEENFISITPIQCDATNYKMMESLSGWETFKTAGKLKN